MLTLSHCNRHHHAIWSYVRVHVVGGELDGIPKEDAKLAMIQEKVEREGKQSKEMSKT